MGLFSRDEPIILKESDNAKRQLAQLEALRGTLPAGIEKQLEADIRAVRAGIVGEERILFELRNSHMDMVVLQDLFLEHEGLTAQIDFLVITPQRTFVIECKNLYGDIEIDAHGNFIRTFGGRKREGIYSPVAQNQRHLKLINAMKKAQRGTAMNLLVGDDFWDIYRSLVVLANPKTVLVDRDAPANVRSSVIRADQLVGKIAEVNSERGIGRTKALHSVIRENGEWYLAHDKGGGGADYVAKYRQLAVSNPGQAPVAGGSMAAVPVQASIPTASSIEGQKVPTPAFAQSVSIPRETACVPAMPSSASQSAGIMTKGHSGGPIVAGSSTSGSAVLCPRCGAPMVVRTAKRGERAGRQFYGCSMFPKCRGLVNIEE